jgi:hypothetical protein
VACAPICCAIATAAVGFQLQDIGLIAFVSGRHRCLSLDTRTTWAVMRTRPFTTLHGHLDKRIHAEFTPNF